MLCQNCDNVLRAADKYCSKCGQKRIEAKDLSFRHLFRESFLDYFHFDSKFFKTIGPLIFRPGMLTLEFLAGRRKRYVEPFKMFLVISVICFLVMAIDKPYWLQPSANKPAGSTQIVTAGKDDKTGNDLHVQVGGLAQTMDSPDTMRAKVAREGIDGYLDKKFPKAGKFEKILLKKYVRLTLEGQKSLYEVMMHNASRMIFLLIPVTGLLLKLVFIRRKRLYFEHLIFSLHFHSFVFLIMLLTELFAFFFKVPLLILLGIFLIYFLFALKRFYAQGWGKTILKTAALTLLYLIIALPLFFGLLAGVSMAMY
jgi:hypothetical protein